MVTASVEASAGGFVCRKSVVFNCKTYNNQKNTKELLWIHGNKPHKKGWRIYGKDAKKDRERKTDSSSQTIRDTGIEERVWEKETWQLINISLSSLLAPI